MNCIDCNSYNRGKGTKTCLKCKQYIEILKQSTKRTTIPIDIVPDTILHAIPDNKEMDIKQALQQLPLEYSVPLMMYHVLNASQREISNYLNISQQQASKKINFAIDIIKKITVFE